MAVKYPRRGVPKVSYQKFYQDQVENEKNCRRSLRSRSGLDLSPPSTPKIAKKNRKLSHCEKDLCGITSCTVKEQVAHQTLRSSYKSCINPQRKTTSNEKVASKKICKNKLSQEQATSHHSPKTSPYKLRSLRNYSGQRKLSAKYNKSSSRLSSETSVLTRLQRKSLDLNMKLLKQSENASRKIYSMNTDLPKDSTKNRHSCDKNRNTLSKISPNTILGSQKTLLTRSMSAHPIIDCLTLNISSGTVKDRKVLSTEKVYRMSPRLSNMYSATKKGKSVRSNSEKISSNLKPTRIYRTRMKSLPIDDLICMTSKFVSKKKSMKVSIPKPVSKFITKESNKARNDSKSPKVSKILNAETPKCLPKKTVFSKIQTSSIDSKLCINRKRKHNSNDISGNTNSNSVVERRTTRSSILTEKSMNSETSLYSENINKKSKRYTFPMHTPNSKYHHSSQNHLRTHGEVCNQKLNSISSWNPNSIIHKTVPIDDLALFHNSFHASSFKPSRTKYASSLPNKHVSKKRSIQDNSGVSSKSKRTARVQEKKTSNLQRKSILGLSNSVPTKGTLKRKRWIFNTLKERTEGYEDDIFESRKFDEIKTALQISDDESDTTDNSIATPKCGFLLTPSLPKKTPMYKECISSSELLEARKNAEEYQYRRMKKWKSGTKNGQNSLNMTGTLESELEIPEKKKLDYTTVLENVIAEQKNLEKLTQEESEEEDDYFSEASD